VEMYDDWIEVTLYMGVLEDIGLIWDKLLCNVYTIHCIVLPEVTLNFLVCVSCRLCIMRFALERSV